MFGELLVRDDVSVIDGTNASDLIEHVLEHRLARDRQQRLWLIHRQWIKPRRVTRGEND